MFRYPRRRPADDPLPPSRSGAPLLEIDGLSVGYERAGAYTPVLENVGLTVGDGEFVCVVGASGCGKTTLLKAIDGLIAPAAGEVRVSGRPPDPRRGDMAVVFQQDSLYPWRTVLANVRFGLDLRGSRSATTDARSRECIELVGLRGFEDHYPHELSGGMRQRVNLARALAVDPAVLLMDEPFSGLDSRLKDTVRAETLAILRQSRATAIIVTHDAEEAMRLADRIALLRDGLLVQVGTAEDLYLRPADLFAAGFFSELNVLNGRVSGGRVETPLGSVDAGLIPSGTAVTVAVRTNGFELSEIEGKAEARVLSRRYLGVVEQLELVVAGLDEPVSARVRSGMLPAKARDIWLTLRPDDVLLFETSAENA